MAMTHLVNIHYRRSTTLQNEVVELRHKSRQAGIYGKVDHDQYLEPGSFGQNDAEAKQHADGKILGKPDPVD